MLSNACFFSAQTQSTIRSLFTLIEGICKIMFLNLWQYFFHKSFYLLPAIQSPPPIIGNNFSTLFKSFSIYLLATRHFISNKSKSKQIKKTKSRLISDKLNYSRAHCFCSSSVVPWFKILKVQEGVSKLKSSILSLGMSCARQAGCILLSQRWALTTF